MEGSTPAMSRQREVMVKMDSLAASEEGGFEVKEVLSGKKKSIDFRAISKESGVSVGHLP